MTFRLAVQALSASLAPAETVSPPPSSSPISRRRLAASASTALLSSSSFQLLAPAAARGAGEFDLRITVPEESSEEAEAVVRAHARNLLRVKRLIDAAAWRELQAELRASASNLKQDLYAIIQASPASQRSELRELYSDLFNSVTDVSTAKFTQDVASHSWLANRTLNLERSAICVQLDYAARDKDELQVQEYYGNIVTALDKIFDKIN
jgi:hypothetical protein